MGIGTDFPDQSSILEIKDTTRGILLPRMDENQMNAILNPSIGLMVYNTTDSCFNFFNGNVWINLCEAVITNGNDHDWYDVNLSSSPDNITDTIYTYGMVGIGVSVPERTLHVNDVLRLEPRLGAPSNPSEGDIYYDLTDNKLRVWNGSAWLNLH